MLQYKGAGREKALCKDGSRVGMIILLGRNRKES
jgi:hypothetical protein